MKMKFINQKQVVKLIFSLIIISDYAGYAQLKGGHLLGAMGIQSGSQAPVQSLSLYLPRYLYNTSSLRNADGDKSTANPDLNMFLSGLVDSYVTDFKILGANYGAGILLPFTSNTIQGNFIDSKSSFAFSDIYLQPLQLGWHFKKSDFVFSYQVFLPAGKYKMEGDNNSGLGTIINEFSAGTTLFFNETKTIHFSVLGSYEMNGKKKNTEIKTGDILSLEGGVGKTFYVLNKEKTAPKAFVNAGLIYYLQYKVSSDKIPIDNLILRPEKDKIYALGAEINFLHFSSSNSAGLRWATELGLNSDDIDHTIPI